MFEILQAQAVTLRTEKPTTERITKGLTSESRIQITKAPKEVSTFLDFVPLGFQLEAVVRRATRREVVLQLQFLGRNLEITVKNLLGIEFKPGQKVLLTLIDRNPYVLKLTLPLAKSHQIFSQIRNYFQNPLSTLLEKFLKLPQIPNLIANSGLFYEAKVVRYLLGQEKRENLRKDLKYKLQSLIKGFGFDHKKYLLIPIPLGHRVKFHAKLPFYRVSLVNFLKAYAAFNRLSPERIETFANFILLTQEKIKKKLPKSFKKVQKRELDRPIFFHTLDKQIYAPFTEKAVSFSLLKELVDFIQFLQGWSIVQNYSKVVIPFTYKGRKFFVGFYKSGNRKNISLLWERGLVKLSYLQSNPWQGELLFVFKDERTLNRFKTHIEELKKELQEVYFTVTDTKFAVASNPEELFILDMADKEHSNFLKMYL